LKFLVEVEQWNGLRPLFFLRLIPSFCYALCIIALIGSVVI
jgi:hypothetical protein